MSSAKEILEEASEKHGWDDATKVYLLLSFVDHLEFLCETTEDIPDAFDRWLKNRIRWGRFSAPPSTESLES